MAKVKATKESAQKAMELLEDQGVFISEEAYDYLKSFIRSVTEVLPSDSHARRGEEGESV